MADAVTNMIVRLLNTNDSPEDALKLVTQFLSIAIQRKLKLDPKLINEIISTVIHNFSEFVDQLEIEDATKLFSIASDLQDIQPIHIIQSQNRSSSSTPTIDLSSENSIVDDVIPLDEFAPIYVDVNNEIHVFVSLSQLTVPVVPVSESHALPNESIFLVNEFNDPKQTEKDFIATPSYLRKPKTIQEPPGDVEMSEADDVPTKPVIELSPSELKIAHPWSNMFKVRNLDSVFSKVFVIPQSSFFLSCKSPMDGIGGGEAM
nr:uncharacterized protein LOC109150211 [Ipomoea batatas]